MRRRFSLMIMVALACPLAISSLGLAQVPPVAVKVEVKQLPKKQEDVKKVEVKKEEAVPAKAAVMVKAIQLGRRAAPGPVTEGQIQEMAQQQRPCLLAEYRLVREVCELDPTQRQAIAREGELALMDAATKCAEMQAKMMNGGWNGQEAQADPGKLIVAGLAKAVSQHLPAIQSEKYVAEIKKREDDFNLMTIHAIVTKIDRDLVLSGDQRESITREMKVKFQDAWSLSQSFLQYGDDYLPAAPDQAILPFLNSNQKKVWTQGQRNHGMVWGNFGMNGQQLAEEKLEYPELVEARKAIASERAQATAEKEKEKEKAPPAKTK